MILAGASQPDIPVDLSWRFVGNGKVFRVGKADRLRQLFAEFPATRGPNPGHRGHARRATSGEAGFRGVACPSHSAHEVAMSRAPTTSTRSAVELAIVSVRGDKVILDADLATLYGVDVRALNQAVKRNHERFPADFMFQLTPAEAAILRSQSVISRSAHGGRRRPPFAFTEQGVAMLSSVLRSEQAVRVNIEIMRAVVRLRALLQQNGELAAKLAALEKKYDARFRVVFEAIRDLMKPPPRPRRRIGFAEESD